MNRELISSCAWSANMIFMTSANSINIYIDITICTETYPYEYAYVCIILCMGLHIRTHR